MSLAEISLPTERQYTVASPRLLGTLGILASPMFLVQGLALGFGDQAGSSLAALLNFIFLSGWICSVIGLRQLRATGKSGLSQAIFGVQLLGLSLAASQEVQDLLYGHAIWTSVFYQIADAAWPLSGLFMLVAGGLTLRARVWRGWRRFTPLFCGLTLPLAVGVGAMAGAEAMRLALALFFSVAWMLLGYAVRSGSRSVAVVPGRPATQRTG